MGLGGTKLGRSNPWQNKSAIHSASLTSVLRPGTFLTCCALATTISKAPSKRALTGFQYTPARFRVPQTVVPLPARVSLLHGICVVTEGSRPPSHRLQRRLVPWTDPYLIFMFAGAPKAHAVSYENCRVCTKNSYSGTRPRVLANTI